jgi:phosphoribosylformylglycinamidine (FGAM) synthase PurS component
MKNILLAIFLIAPSLLFSQNKVCLSSIQNQIQIGQMMGNKNLAFGFKNIMLEFLQDKDYELIDSCNLADYRVEVELLFLDVLKTSSGVSVFHKQNDETILRVRGKLLDPKGKKIKETVVTEKSSEISMSSLIVTEGGGFNQQAVSNVIKKSCETLIVNLFKE